VVLGRPAVATVLVTTSPGIVGWKPSNITTLIDNETSQSLRLLRTVHYTHRSFIKTHRRTTERRLPYVITHCCLPLDITSERASP